jgi:hypothetical protein
VYVMIYNYIGGGVEISLDSCRTRWHDACWSWLLLGTTSSPGKDFSRVLFWVWLLPIYQMMALMDVGVVPVWNEQLFLFVGGFC